MLTPRRLLLAVGLFLALGAAASRAAEGDDAVKKQKAEAEANLKGADLKFAAAETTDLLVYGAFSEAKVQALATAVQKSHASATKILQVKPDEKVWTGKLTVYLLADAKQAKVLIQRIEKKIADRRDTYRINARGDTPFVLLPLELGAKSTDALMAAEASAYVGAAVLRSKIGGTSPPEWLLLGFGRVAHVRADGPMSPRMTAHKAKVKSLLNKTRGIAFKWTIVEGAQGGSDNDLLATSLVEYLAFGPMADKFNTLVGALKPNENGDSPSFAQALQVLEWPVDMFDGGWQMWVAKGK